MQETICVLLSLTRCVYCVYISPYHYYTEHCSVGPTKLIGTTTTIASTMARMKKKEDF